MSNVKESLPAPVAPLPSAIRHPLSVILQPWLALALILLACLPPLLVSLGRRDATRTMERVTLITSQETWFRQNGHGSIQADASAWMMPSLDGRPRVTKPPLAVWLNMLAWTGLDSQTASLETLIYRARLLAVGMGLLTLACTFWAGMSLDGLGLAVIASLVLGSTWFFQRLARTASYDIELTAWTTLAIAAALWAMKSMEDRRWRGTVVGVSPRATATNVEQAWPSSLRSSDHGTSEPDIRHRKSAIRYLLGWALAAIALAAGWMTKGPLAIVVTVLPLTAMMLALGCRKRGDWLALIGMLVGAAVLALPWYVYAELHVPGSMTTWATEYRAGRDEFQPPWYYVAVLAMVAPWTLWLVGGLLFPFLRGGKNGAAARQPLNEIQHDKSRRFVVPSPLTPWLWFVVIFLFFSIPGAKQQRYILPIMPAAALVVAWLWRYHQALSEAGEHDPGVNLLRVPHWAALIIVSLAIGPFLVLQRWMMAQGWFAHWPIGPIHTSAAILGAIVLVIAAIIGTWLHFRWKPRAAALATALWALMLTTLYWQAYSNSPQRIHPIRTQVARVEERVGGRPVYYLGVQGRDVRIDMAMLLYLRRIVPKVSLDALEQKVQAARDPVYVMVPKVDAKTTAAMTALGGIPLEHLPGALSEPARLWKF